MSLVKNVGTIGGLTAVSRVFGFVRDMLLARVLGAGLAADAWQLAFTLPNTFRRLFAEGAFSVAFVPMYTRRLHAEEDGGDEAADRFASDVLSVFVWVLLGFSALCMIAMPGIVWLLAREYQDVPGKFELSVMLSRVTFPYLALVSLVAMLSGVLNARSKFAPGAVVPVLLNIVMIGGILTGWYLRGDSADDLPVAWALAISLALAGVAQLIYMWWATRRAGVKLQIKMPKITPDVKRLMMLMLPATFGAGIYQISQLVDTFFATSLPQGSLTLLKLADRLNQMPLGIFGIALGTAILPMLARHIQSDNHREAQRLQGNAVEIAMLLCLPCAVALSICAEAFTAGIFQGGRMAPEDTAIMGNIVIALVCGLPAYVLVKVLVPNFYARSDTRTPVYAAFISLVVFAGMNVAMIGRFGVVGVAFASVVGAWINVGYLYAVLVRRDYYRIPLKLVGRIARQLVAAAAMGAALWFTRDLLTGWYDAGLFARAGALAALVVCAGAVYFGIAFAIGAIDRQRITTLTRKTPVPESDEPATDEPHDLAP